MSVSFALDYACTIQGKQKDFEKIPEIVRKIPGDKWFERLTESIVSSAEAALADGGPLSFAFYAEEDDGSHGRMAEILNPLDEALPGLTLFVYASGFESDYGRYSYTDYLSPPGKSALKLEWDSPFSGRRDWERYQLQGRKKLTCLQIPDHYDKKWSIGSRQFQGCVNLTDIILPPSVTKIAKTAFKDCKSLTIHAWPGSFAETFANERGIPLHLME